MMPVGSPHAPNIPAAGDTEIWVGGQVALSEARRPCRPLPAPPDPRRKELHRAPITPYNDPTAGHLGVGQA